MCTYCDWNLFLFLDCPRNNNEQFSDFDGVRWKAVWTPVKRLYFNTESKQMNSNEQKKKPKE